jgi:hypothetical protein
VEKKCRTRVGGSTDDAEFRLPLRRLFRDQTSTIDLWLYVNPATAGWGGASKLARVLTETTIYSSLEAPTQAINFAF